jgi:hypothetical protein
MKTRTAWAALPLVATALLLSGCGLTAADAGKTSTDRVFMPSTEVCHSAAYIRERAPEGVCDTRDLPATGSGGSAPQLTQ